MGQAGLPTPGGPPRCYVIFTQLTWPRHPLCPSIGTGRARRRPRPHCVGKDWRDRVISVESFLLSCHTVYTYTLLSVTHLHNDVKPTQTGHPTFHSRLHQPTSSDRYTYRESFGDLRRCVGCVMDSTGWMNCRSNTNFVNVLQKMSRRKQSKPRALKSKLPVYYATCCLTLYLYVFAFVSIWSVNWLTCFGTIIYNVL